MTYQSDETISLTKVADSNLPKEESSSRRKWLAAVAAALIVGGGTMVVSSSSSNTNGTILSNSLEESLVDVDVGCSTYISKVADPIQKICSSSCCYYDLDDCGKYGATYCYTPFNNDHTRCCKYNHNDLGDPFNDGMEVQCCDNAQY